MRLIALMNSYTQGASGGDIRFIELAKRLEEKIEICVITSSLGVEVCVSNGLDAKYMITTREESVSNVPLLYLKRIILALRLSLRLKEGDILCSTSDFLPDTLPAFVWKLKNRKLKWLAPVYHLVPKASSRAGGSLLKNVLSYVSQQISLRLISRLADLINTETTFVKNELSTRYGIPPERIVAVPSGIDPRIIDNVKWNGRKIYDACFIARIHPTKGILDLVRAWKEVSKQKGDAKLAIGGTGPTEFAKMLLAEIERFRLGNNVDILGFLSEEEKYKLLKASRIYILPSYEEGVPITFYEAMYCGLPVITYYLPTYTEIKDYIVKVSLGNLKRLADEIIRVLDDEDLARKLGDMGRGFAVEHTWDKVADCISSKTKGYLRMGE